MKKLFLFALVVSTLSACKKDSENSPSKTDLLTSKKWRITAETETSTVTTTGSAPITTTSNQYATTPACEKDNFTQFSTNKTFVEDEGASKCDPNDPQTTSGTWDLPGDQTKLIVGTSGVPGTNDFEVLELTSSTLRLRDSYSYSSSGITYSGTSEITFTSF
jgi:hypothetical protein